jgi:type IV pilus assembly protein PilQ
MKQKVYTVFWVYMVSRVIKLNELYRRNGLHCRNRLTCSLLLGFMLFAFSGCATTQTGDIKESLEPREATLITGLDIQDHAVTITANKPFIYTIHRPIDPFKMTIELPDVSIGPFNNRIVSDKAGITELVPYQIKLPSLMAKIEILLQTPSLVEPEYKDNALKIKIKEEELAKEESGVRGQESGALEEKEEASKTKEDIPEPAPVEQEPLPEATEISSIAFERSAGLVKVLIKGNGSMTPNVFPLEDRIIIDVPEVVLNTTLPSAVVSPVKGIRSGKHEDKVRLVLDLKEKTNFDVATVRDSIVIALQGFEEKPSALPAAQRPEKAEVAEVKEPEALVEGKYTGKKVSLDFQDADIAPIIRLLADMSGYNIVLSPEVKGKLTMKLINVPWDQALDLILKTFSLGKDVEGNIIRIAPYAVLAKESEEAAKAQEAGIKAEPLEPRIFPISYADVSVVETSIKNSKILTTRGSISADKRTSTMVIKDVATVFPEVENLLLTLDRPTPQVMIEARIVEMSTSGERDFGIQWGGFVTGRDPNLSFGGFSGLNTGPFTGKNFLVDFPAAAKGSGITFGILNAASTVGLDLQLSALELMSKGKIISNPRIVTTDNVTAKIMQGESVPYTQPATEAGGKDTTSFKDVAISVEVTPHITPANSIVMVVKTTKEELMEFVQLSSGAAPRTTKIEGSTTVLVENGETMVIGGMYKKVEKVSSGGVPGLMNIPILGWLFKNNQATEDTRELMIFITPRIVQKP